MTANAAADSSFELIVIGAGPAGMAAATTAADFGCSVCLLDEQPTAGGQIYRSLSRAGPTNRVNGDSGAWKNTAGKQAIEILGKAYFSGLPLIEKLSAANVHTVHGACVWHVGLNGEDGVVTYSRQQHASRISGRHIIIASGAMERPMPLPGWTLPGVLTAGAGQILLKTDGLATDNSVLIGTGPLLYYFATQLIRSGCKPKALIDTGNGVNRTAIRELLPVALHYYRPLLTGLSMLSQIKRAGVNCYSGASAIEILGDSRASGVRCHYTGGKQINIDCDFVFMHDGVIPNTHISRSLQLRHQWNSVHRYHEPAINDGAVSSQSNISIAGDGSGIIGAEASAQHGKLASLTALKSLGYDTEGQSKNRQRQINAVGRSRQFQRFLARLYPPLITTEPVADNTIVCRCEQVTAAEIKRCVELGCTGPNQTKAYTRCGMGPCQGRYCGLTVANIIARESNLPAETIGTFRVRSPLKPVTIAELASLADTPPIHTQMTTATHANDDSH